MSSHGQPTRGGPPSSGVGRVITTHRKNVTDYETFHKASDWTVVLDWDKWRALLYKAMNFRVPWYVSNAWLAESLLVFQEGFCSRELVRIKSAWESNNFQLFTELGGSLPCWGLQLAPTLRLSIIFEKYFSELNNMWCTG
jgi:hypothetical protein